MTVARYVVVRGVWERGRFVGERLECDELPEPLYTHPYVSVTCRYDCVDGGKFDEDVG